MSNLILPVKKQYFEQIESGEKDEEYRLISAHWKKRFEGKKFDFVIITLGYPSRDDQDRRIIFPFRGIRKKTIQHEEFGKKPTEVYAIALKNRQFQLC